MGTISGRREIRTNGSLATNVSANVSENLQYQSEQGGLGAIVSNVTQITEHTGPQGNLVNGFEGGALDAVPFDMYVVKVVKATDPGLIFQLRWVREFEATNMLRATCSCWV
jgi:hypothetical protein